jgi:putative ABC transport system permease protein
MGTLLQDVRYALRMLGKSPGFTAVAVATLALGIGANTAIFSIVHAALLRPLPYAAPQRLYTLGEVRPQIKELDADTSYPDLQDWQRATKTFESLAAYAPDSVTVTGTGAPENLRAARCSYNFFMTLGVSPMLGRDFQLGEDKAGGAKVVLLTSPYWKTHFASNPAALGQSLRLEGVSYTVVGVLPDGFEFAPAGSAVLWQPLNLDAQFAARRSLRWLHVVGRLNDGVTFPQGLAEMRTINAALAAAHPKENGAIEIVISELRERIVGQVRPLLLVLLGAVGFVLFIACANVAHLMLMRATTRRKEIAIRVALGARRLDVVRQLLTESVLLSILGGVIGVFLASWGGQLLIAVIPERTRREMPFLSSAQIDFSTFVFLVAISFLAGLASGLIPAWQMAGSESGEALKEETRTSTGGRMVLLRDTLVLTELAVSIVLLTGAGLMVRSLNALLRQNPGFDGRNVLTFVVSLPESSYKDDPSFIQFEHRLRQALLQLPGVQETAVVSRLPLTAAGNTIRFVIEGHPKAKGEEDEANMRDVSPGYFALMKIPVLEGRNYGPEDDIKAPPRMVVNQAFVDRYLSGESPLGKRVKFTYSDALPLQEIIGVVANENSEGLDAPVRPIIYNSFEQDPNSAFYVVMRTAQDPESMISAARGALQGIDSQLPMIEPRSIEGVISDSYGVFLRRFPSRLITSFALLALTLAAVGLYGQISFGVAQRTREIGVRMALGARSGDVMRLIMARGLALTVGGLVVGTAAALVFTRLLSSLLFGVTPADPWTMSAAVVVLAAVSFAASFIPARRATKVDPMIALRYE